MMKKLSFLLSFMLIAAVSAGQAWISQASGFSTPSRGIYYIHSVDTTTVWATAYDGTNPNTPIQEFTRTTNGGATWTPGTVGNAVGHGISMIYAIDGLTAWVPAWGPTGGGKILKTVDGGISWVHQTTATFSAPDGFPNVVHFWNSNDGWCQGDPNGGYFEFYTTTNGGTTWTRVPQANIPPPLTGEWGVTGYLAVQGNTVWFSTNKGRVYKSTNKGLNWTVSQTPITASQIRISFANQNLGLVQENVSPYRLCRTTDGGATWQLMTYSGMMFANSFCHVPGTNSTFVSTGADIGNQLAGVSWSSDGGSNWNTFPGTDTIQFLNISFANPRHGWAGGFNQSNTQGGMWKYSGNDFTADPCAGVQAAFTPSATVVYINVSGVVNFTDQSTGNPTAWHWDFGDGNTSNQQNPTHTYTTLGYNTVKLIITKDNCVDSTDTMIEVKLLNSVSGHTKPEIDFAPNITGDYFFIRNAQGYCLIEIYDISGRKVLVQKDKGLEIKVSVDALPQGAYILHLLDENGNSSTGKLFVSRVR